MNAGDVVVRLIADLKGFSVNVVKAVGELKGFGKSGKASLSEVDKAITSGVASMSRYAKAAKTSFGDAEKAMANIAKRTQAIAGSFNFAAVTAASKKNLKDQAAIAASSSKSISTGWSDLFKKVAVDANAASVRSAEQFSKTWGASLVRSAASVSTFSVAATKAFGQAAVGAYKFSSQALVHIKSFSSKAVSVLSYIPQRISGAFSGLNTVFTRLFNFRNLVVVAGAGAAVREFAGFDEQIAKVNSVLGDASEKWLPRYRSAIQSMAIEFGESTGALSNGLYEILQAVFPADEALDILTVGVKAAKAGFTDTATAINGITNVMNAYGQGAYSATQVADMLWAAIFRGKGEFAAWANSVGAAMAIARESGVRFEEVAAALANITRNGVSVDEAVTGVRQALITLSGREEEAIKVARLHGVELSVNALRQKGLIGMTKELGKLSPEVRHEILREIRARTALNIMIGHETELTEDLLAVTSSAGMNQKAFGTATKNLNFSLSKLGQVLLSIIRHAVEPWVESIQNTAKWMEKNQAVTAKWAKTMGVHAVYAKDVFGELTKSLGTVPGETMDAFLGALADLLGAAAELAVSMAIKIGEGIWKGVKEGILKGGPSEFEINERAVEIFKKKGGATLPGRKYAGNEWGLDLPGYNQAETGVDAVTGVFPPGYTPYTFNQAIEQAKADILAEKAREITQTTTLSQQAKDTLSGLTAKWGSRFRGTSASPGLDEAAKKHRESIGKIDAEFSKKPLAKEYYEAWTDAVIKAYGGTKKLAHVSDDLASGIESSTSPAITSFTEKLNRELEGMRALNGVIMKGHTAYEAMEIKQGLLNEAFEAGITDLQAITPLIEKHIEQMLELQQQQRERGGFLGGLRDLKGELPTLKEHLYDLGKATREGLGSALADIALDARDLRETITSLIKSMARMAIEWQMQRSVAGAMGAMPWNRAVPSPISMGTPGAGGVKGFARGGIVYASSGMFRPRGTDTVPAMLTPGEGVLDTETTSRLRRILDVPSRGGTGGAPQVNFEVNNYTPTQVTAEQTDVRFDGQKLYVGMALKDKRNNGPISRAGRRG